MARIRCNTSSKSKVESTAWPASYKTASFGMVERIVRRGKGVTEVPKVTGLEGGREPASRLSPLSCGADQSVGHQAEPEIQNHAQVQMEAVVSRRRRQRWGEDEVHHVAQYDRQQSLEIIDKHRWFRHRSSPASFDGLYSPSTILTDDSFHDARAGGGVLLLPFFCHHHGNPSACSNSPPPSNM